MGSSFSRPRWARTTRIDRSGFKKWSTSILRTRDAPGRKPRTTSQDPTGRIFNWDQRAGVATDGRLVTFTWTYDHDAARYANIHRRLSRDGGETWTEPEDLGFMDQPSHPAMLPDGRVVLAWVDRFGTRSIRARMAESVDAPFLEKTEVVLYQLGGDNGFERYENTRRASIGSLCVDLWTSLCRGTGGWECDRGVLRRYPREHSGFTG